MTDLLEEYKAYYKARKERYENNPKYPRTFETENAMYEAMNSCSELIEFKEKLGNLNEQNAVNLTLDQYKIRKDYFDSLNESVRVLASNRILEKAALVNTAQEVITIVHEEENQNSIEISMDESVRAFISDDWKYLDDIEVYGNAVVPSKYQSEMDRKKLKAIENIKQGKIDIEKNNRAWDPNWTYEPKQNLIHHHLRLVPYSKEHLEEKLNEYNSYL